MDDLLYLDTARMGRMCTAARAAHQNFTELAGEVGGSVLIEQFLCRGFSALPTKYQKEFFGLTSWHGTAQFLESIRLLCRHQFDLPVLLANRSAQLMKLAAVAMFNRCRNVLITDLGWPGYHTILAEECRRERPRQISTVSIYDALTQSDCDECALVDRICEAFSDKRCDGLFLPAVSSRGIVLPVERIVKSIEAIAELRFVVIDGAQGFCHIGTNLSHECFDLYLTGCHKWLSALLPMGIALYGKRRSAEYIEATLDELITDGGLDDPLLRFARQLAKGKLDTISETVSLSSLFSAQAAAMEFMAPGQSPADRLQLRRVNRASAAVIALSCGWRPLVDEPSFQSGILLLEAERPSTRKLSSQDIRESLFAAGVAATTYDGGLVRLSMPDYALQDHHLDHLMFALSSAA